MKIKHFVFGALFALLVVVGVGANHDETGTVRYRQGAVLSFDSQVTFRDEDGRWTFNAANLGIWTNTGGDGTTISLTDETNQNTRVEIHRLPAGASYSAANPTNNEYSKMQYSNGDGLLEHKVVDNSSQSWYLDIENYRNDGTHVQQTVAAYGARNFFLLDPAQAYGSSPYYFDTTASVSAANPLFIIKNNNTIKAEILGDGNYLGNISISTNNVNTQSANYNLLSTDAFVLLSANKTATLPTAVGIPGKSFTVLCTGSGTNAILTTSAQTISGATKWTNTAQYKFTTVISDNANWWVVGQN